MIQKIRFILTDRGFFLVLFVCPNEYNLFTNYAVNAIIHKFAILLFS